VGRGKTRGKKKKSGFWGQARFGDYRCKGGGPGGNPGRFPFLQEGGVPLRGGRGDPGVRGDQSSTAAPPPAPPTGGGGGWGKHKEKTKIGCFLRGRGTTQKTPPANFWETRGQGQNKKKTGGEESLGGGGGPVPKAQKKKKKKAGGPAKTKKKKKRRPFLRVFLRGEVGGGV